jgi:hypothetical protein
MIDAREIEAGILQLIEEYGAGRSVSPGDVARSLAADWRPLLGPVRRAAVRLARKGQIEIVRKGRPIAPDDIRGVIRLRACPPGSP